MGAIKWRSDLATIISKLSHSAVRLEAHFSLNLDTEVKNPLLKHGNLISQKIAGKSAGKSVGKPDQRVSFVNEERSAQRTKRAF